jgi:hypothetical protein
MKTALLAALLFGVTPASAWPAAPHAIAQQFAVEHPGGCPIAKPCHTGGNPNYGKADDYGSERFAAVNYCMVANLTAAPKDKVSIEVCMNDNGFAFCPDCKIFGNKGPRCLDEDHLHSWCWVKEDER